MKMNNWKRPGTRDMRRGIHRFGVALAVALVVAGCATTTYPTARPGSTGSVLNTAREAESGQPIIDASQEADPGITDTEIYEGSGVFIDEQAARPRAQPMAEDGEIVLNFEGESIQSVVHTVLGEVLKHPRQAGLARAAEGGALSRGQDTQAGEALDDPARDDADLRALAQVVDQRLGDA